MKSMIRAVVMVLAGAACCWARPPAESAEASKGSADKAFEILGAFDVHNAKTSQEAAAKAGLDLESRSALSIPEKRIVPRDQKVVFPPPEGTIQRLTEEERKRLFAVARRMIEVGDNAEYVETEGGGRSEVVLSQVWGRVSETGSPELFKPSSLDQAPPTRDREDADSYWKRTSALFDASHKIYVKTKRLEDGSQELVWIFLAYGFLDEAQKILPDGRISYSSIEQVKPERQKVFRDCLAFWSGLSESAQSLRKGNPFDAVSGTPALDTLKLEGALKRYKSLSIQQTALCRRHDSIIHRMRNTNDPDLAKLLLRETRDVLHQVDILQCKMFGGE